MLYLRAISLSLILGLSLPALARTGARGIKGFLKSQHPPTGRLAYIAGLRVPCFAGKALGKLGLGRSVVQRRILQVTDRTLKSFTRATSKGYLEVVVPANTGHLFFRHGGEVFDFYQGGFRVGPVRPIGKPRYGMLVKLTPAQEKRLTAYLERLKQTGGKELGAYDFSGRKGFHCVSWFLRLGLDQGPQTDLVHLLGGEGNRGWGMPSFSRFMLKRARPMETVILYDNKPRTSGQLSRTRFRLKSNRQIVKDFRAWRAQQQGPASR